MKKIESTEYILSLSYGKDSIACIEAVKQLGYPLDRIVHAEIWATDTIPADLPPMVEFKKHADKVIKQRYGIDVEHICATTPDGEKKTYEKVFLTTYKNGKHKGLIYGFPVVNGAWCNSRLKVSALNRISNRNKVTYIGIAADEPKRIARHSCRPNIILPLVEIGWDEAYCRKWCEEKGLLSPIYTTSTRGGCWFCHNQSINQLRLLRKNYPDYWQLLLKWDSDSPVSFKPDGHTVHDFDKRFKMEDDGIIKPNDRKFRWKQILKEGNDDEQNS